MGKEGKGGNRVERVAAMGAPQGVLDALWERLLLLARVWQELRGSGLGDHDAAELVRRSLESDLRTVQVVMGERPWRATHVSRGALALLASSSSAADLGMNLRGLQRAHGLRGRLERTDRDRAVLEGLRAARWAGLPELMEFYREHDASVIVLRSEHSRGGGLWLGEADLVAVDDRELFPDGLGVIARMGREVEWARRKLTGP